MVLYVSMSCTDRRWTGRACAGRGRRVPARRPEGYPSAFGMGSPTPASFVRGPPPPLKAKGWSLGRPGMPPRCLDDAAAAAAAALMGA